MKSPKFLLFAIFSITTFGIFAQLQNDKMYQNESNFSIFESDTDSKENSSNDFWYNNTINDYLSSDVNADNQTSTQIEDTFESKEDSKSEFFKSLISANDPCTDGAIVGTPTLNDFDGDGVNNICDLDDDNDGILDEDEACANAVSNFPNAEKGYLFQGNPTQVYLVDISTGATTLHQTLNYYINGVTVNEDDNLFWAVDKTNNKVVLVDPYTFNIVETLSTTDSAVSGAYDPIKKEYVTVTKNDIQVFDGDPNSPTYKTEIKNFTNTTGKNVIDLGYNTSDGGLYGIPGGTNDLYKVDTTNESITLIGDISGLPDGSYGAIYTTLDGNFYMSNNNTGVIYKMELRNGLTATAFANGPSSSINDGAKVLSVDLSGQQVCLDTDDDGSPNSQDLDSDADGFYDVEEAGGVDEDGDGMLDGDGFDSDGKVTGGTGGYNGSAGTENQAHQMSITTAPTDQTTGYYDAATFTVVATAEQATNYLNGSPVYDSPGNATGRIVYQWYRGNPDTDGVALSNTGVYSGTDTATLSISSSQGLHSNRYYVRLTHLDNNLLEETTNAQLIADPCDALASGNPDNDSDGVADDCDDDDDNDGVLDSNECKVIYNETPFTVADGNSVNFTLDNVGNSFLLDVTYLDNSFNITINGTSLTTQEIQFQEESTPTGRNIRFKDGSIFGLNGVPQVYAYGTEISEDTPIIRFEIDSSSNISMWASKEANGPLYELELFNGNSFNTFIWNSNASNDFVVSQVVTGPTYMTGRVYGTRLDCDIDKDGIENKFEIDSDADGCPDSIESGGVDADKDGILDGSGIDTSNGRVLNSTGGYNGITVDQHLAQKVEITTDAVDLSVTEDQTASFSVTAQASTTSAFNSGTPVYSSLGNDDSNLTYQWYKGDPDNGGEALVNEGIYSGTDTATLDIEIVSGLDNTDFYVIAGNVNTCVNDISSATLTVTDVAPNTTTLIISQYIESDSGTSPRGIEIFNPLEGDFDFSITNIFINVVTSGNVANYANAVIINSGTLKGGEVLVIGSSEIGDYLNENQLSHVTFIQHNFDFDGDDAIIISNTATNGGTILDMFGELSDPGDEWSGDGITTRNCNLELKDYYNDDQFFTTGNSSGWSNPGSRFYRRNTNPSGRRGLNGCGRAPVRNRWVGGTSRDYHKRSNWRNSSRRNLYCDNVIIPNTGVTNYPRAYSPIHCRSLRIKSGARFRSNSSCTGRVSYERESSSTNWYLIGSPLAGHIFDDDFISTHDIPTANTDRAFAKYVTPTDSWDYLQVGSSFTAEPGVGYSIKRDLTDGPLVFTGSLNIDNVTCSILRTGCGYNLVSNPFTTNISIKDLLEDNSSNLMMQAVWLWNQAEDNYEVYVAADEFVAVPTQGFLVKARNNATLTINKDIQCDDCNGSFQKTAKSEIILRMTDGDKNRLAKIYYRADATTGFDNGLDGRTYHGIPNALDIYTHMLTNSDIGGLNSANMQFQVQSLPNTNHKDMVVPVGITAAAGKEITIRADINSLPSDVNVYLEDRETGNFIDLGTENFKIVLDNPLNGIGRFYLHTKSEAALSTDDVEINTDFINIYSTTENVLTITGLQGNANVRLFSIDGKEVLSTKIQSTGFSEIALPRLAKGIYIVNLDDQAIQLTKKIIIN